MQTGTYNTADHGTLNVLSVAKRVIIRKANGATTSVPIRKARAMLAGAEHLG